MEAIPDSAGIGSALLSLSAIHRAREDYEKAITNGYQGYEMLRKLNVLSKIPHALNTIGATYMEQDKLDSALHYFKRSLDLSKEINDTLFLAHGEYYLGNLYAAIGEFNLALFYLGRSMEEFVRSKNHYAAAKAKLDIGKNLRKLKRNNEAKKVFKEGLFHAEIINSPKLKSGLYLELLNLEKERKNYEAIIDYSEKYINEELKELEMIKDSEINKIKASFELKKKELDLQLTNQQLAIVNAEKRLQVIWRNVFIIGLAITLIAGFVIIKTQSSRLQKIKQLTEAKSALAQAELENVQLREKELRDQIDFKNRELARFTSNFTQKDQIWEQIKNTSKKLINADQADLNKNLEELRQIIENNYDVEEDWENFKNYFENVHPNFFRRMKEAFPNLTEEEQKLCALIRLNLNMKETASITGNTTEAIKKARYRLRKKFGLKRDDDLLNFILKTEKEET